MFTVEEWKLRIVKFFIYRKMRGTNYRIRNEEELFKTFASNFERNTQTAYEELRADKIIEEYRDNPIPFYTLNFSEKGQEIQAIIKNEPFEEKSDLIQPDDKDFKDLRQEFKDASTRGYPNRGFYYFCTKINDPNDWTVLIKTKPNVKPYRIILGSLESKDSRMSKIWKAVLKVSKINKGEPFIRKWVENIEQKACGNNRLPSRSAFQIFIHLGWLKVVSKKGNTVFYQVTKTDE
jgi:hypothetical protein